MQGLAQGFVSPMAHAFGAKDYDGLRRRTGNAILQAIAPPRGMQTGAQLGAGVRAYHRMRAGAYRRQQQADR